MQGRLLAIGLHAVALCTCLANASDRDSCFEQVRRVAFLHGASQRIALHALLASDHAADPKAFPESVFYYGGSLRPALRRMISDPTVGDLARWLLSLIGDRRDLQRMVMVAPPSGRTGLPNRWAYAVATSLLEPRSESDWAFLGRCANGEFHDGWVDYGGIQTLKLIASDRSRRILEEAATKNEFRAQQIARAIEYIRSNPPPLEGRDLVELAKRVALAISIGDWMRNGTPFYDRAGDNAVVEIEFETAGDYLTYTATFDASNGR